MRVALLLRRQGLLGVVLRLLRLQQSVVSRLNSVGDRGVGLGEALVRGAAAVLDVGSPRGHVGRRRVRSHRGRARRPPRVRVGAERVVVQRREAGRLSFQSVADGRVRRGALLQSSYLGPRGALGRDGLGDPQVGLVSPRGDLGRLAFHGFREVRPPLLEGGPIALE